MACSGQSQMTLSATNSSAGGQIQKAAAADIVWTKCAAENGYCAFTGTADVRYGINGTFVTRTLSEGSYCNNSVFGDPAVGLAKECDIATTGTTPIPAPGTPVYTECARENGYCSFAGIAQVRFGANGSYNTLTLTNGTSCTNSVFGDPAVGFGKVCEIVTYPYGAPVPTPVPAQPPVSQYCAGENGYCAFTGTAVIRYGTNGSYNTLTLTNGTHCTNTVFGDPAVGYGKSCEILSFSVAPPPAPNPAPVATPIPLPVLTPCAYENDFCAFTGTQAVRFGSSSAWKTKTFTGGVLCKTANFGDPVIGVAKQCWIVSLSSLPTAPANEPARATVSPSPAPVGLPQPTDSGISQMYSQLNGMCVDIISVQNKAQVVQKPCSNSLSQQLQFVRTSDGFYNIKSAATNSCFDSQGQTTDYPVIQSTCENSDSQKWSITNVGGANYAISAKVGEACLHVIGALPGADVPIYVNVCDGTPEKTFVISNFQPTITYKTPNLIQGLNPMTLSQDQHELAVQNFEAWLGHKVGFAVDFIAKDSWSDFLGDGNWASGIWAGANPSRQVMWSIPLTVEGSTLADVAAGKYDFYWISLAQTLATNQPNALLRIGWEFNGDWYPWTAAGHEQDYIQAFRHVVAIFRQQSSQFTVVWSVNAGSLQVLPQNAYPGDDVVDQIGMSLYDYNWDGTSYEERALDNVQGSYKLQWLAYFARRHNKTMSMDEWGAGDLGDAPTYVSSMISYMKSVNFAYESWWEGPANSHYNAELENGQFPLEAQAFKAGFAK